MAKDLLRLRATATTTDLSGTVTFEKVVRDGNTECLQISGAVDCPRVFPSVPSEVKVEQGFLKIGFSEKLPVVVSLPDPRSLAVGECRLHDEGQTGFRPETR